MPNEIILTKKWSTSIVEHNTKQSPLNQICTDTAGNQINMIRIYKSAPDDITFQIRTFKPTTPRGKAKNMIASVDISCAEWESLKKQIDELFA